jgi:hypothetical protein
MRYLGHHTGTSPAVDDSSSSDDEMDAEPAIEVVEPAEESLSLDDTPEPDAEGDVEEPTSDSDDEDSDADEEEMDIGAEAGEEETDDGLVEAAGYDAL